MKRAAMICGVVAFVVACWLVECGFPDTSARSQPETVRVTRSKSSPEGLLYKKDSDPKTIRDLAK